MSEYRRFIAYIYEYINGKKQKNTGFARIESRNGQCRMQIHLQEIPVEEESLQVHAFVRAGDVLRGIFLGQVPIHSKNTVINITTLEENVGGGGYELSKIAGLWITGQREGCYITCWDDGEIQVEKLVMGREPESEPSKEPEPEQESDMEPEPEPEQEPDKEPEPEQEPDKEPEPNPEQESDMEPAAEPEPQSDVELEQVAEPDVEPTGESETVSQSDLEAAQETVISQKSESKSDLHAQDAEAARLPRYQNQGMDMEKKWKLLSARYRHANPFGEDVLEDGILITPRDLNFLQQNQWQLGRNSFVLHGFYHYRHLLLGKKKDGGYLLCVPGMYDNQERYMGEMFGFPMFYAEKEQNNKRRFGYWCRPVK